MDDKTSQEKTEHCVRLLRNKAAELGDRLPKRSDFSPEEVNLIKQKLGPWPRALEEAGLKERKGPTSAEKNRIKRERSRRAAKLARKNQTER